MYATVLDLRDRYGASVLAQLTDPDDTAKQNVKLASALKAASARIDGYLWRYPLPLAHTPPILVEFACDMAVYGLMATSPAEDNEDARSRYTDAINYLKEVASGKIQLTLPGEAAQPSTPAQETGPEFIAAVRPFTRDTMRGF